MGEEIDSILVVTLKDVGAYEGVRSQFLKLMNLFIFAHYREIPEAVESLKDVINTPDLLLRSVIHCMQIIDPSKKYLSPIFLVLCCFLGRKYPKTLKTNSQKVNIGTDIAKAIKVKSVFKAGDSEVLIFVFRNWSLKTSSAIINCCIRILLM